MTRPEYDYYLVENTYVARFEAKTGRAERLMPDGTWALSVMTREIFDGRPLQDENEARDTGSFLNARNRSRETRRNGDP
jgi:hypothetical protein